MASRATPPVMGKHKLKILILMVLALIVVLGGAWQVKRRADRELAEARARQEKQDLIPFEQKSLTPISSKAIEIWQTHQATRAIAKFNDSYFVASDGGLIELDHNGKQIGRASCRER